MSPQCSVNRWAQKGEKGTTTPTGKAVPFPLFYIGSNPARGINRLPIVPHREWSCSLDHSSVKRARFHLHQLLPGRLHLCQSLPGFWCITMVHLIEKKVFWWPWPFWPMTLTFKLDLDILPLNPCAKNQNCTSVRSALRVRQTDRHTHRQNDDAKTITPIADAGCNKKCCINSMAWGLL